MQGNKTLIAIVAGVLVLGVAAAGLMVYMNKTRVASEEIEMANPVNSLPVDSNVQTETPAPTSSTTDTALTGEVKEVTVSASNFKFSPTEIKVRKGQTVRVVFKNLEGTHDFVIDEFEVATNQLGEEEEEEVEFVADKAGSFEYYCSVGNHRKMGMVGKLVVE